MKRSMKRRMLSILTALALCLGMLPGAARAAEGPEVEYSLDGGDTWNEVDTFENMFDKSAFYKATSALVRLKRDVILTWGMSISLGTYAPSILEIDGQGHTISRGNLPGAIFTIQTPKNITFKNVTIDGGAEWDDPDNVESRENEGVFSGGNSNLIYVSDLATGSRIELYDTVLQNNHMEQSGFNGAAIYLGTGSVWMYEGSIIRNNSAVGITGTRNGGGAGAVHIDPGAFMVMEGGEIYGNYASLCAGAVYCQGAFTLKKGKIYHNAAGESCGALRIDVDGEEAAVGISGGEIVDNKAGTPGTDNIVFGRNTSVLFSGGTVSSIASTADNEDTAYNTLLRTTDTLYAYYDANDKLVTGMHNRRVLEDSEEHPAPFTVKECTHEGLKEEIEDGVFEVRCSACGLYTTLTDIAGGEISIVPDTFGYNGQAQMPDVTVTYNGNVLEKDRDYNIYYSYDGDTFDDPFYFESADCIDAGTIYIIIAGRWYPDLKYTGRITGFYTITKATPTIAWDAAVFSTAYTGEPAKIPAPVVTLENDETFDGEILYSYARTGEDIYTPGLPVDAGTYTIRAGIDETDNYTAADCSETLSLTITKTRPVITFLESYTTLYAYSGRPVPLPGENQMSITGASYSDVAFSWDRDPINVGEYILTASLAETSNTAAAEASLDVMIVRQRIDDAVIILTPDHFEYDGRPKTPEVTLKYGDMVIPASEYTVEYSNNTNVGDARVTVTDKEGGNYSISTVTQTFPITKKEIPAIPDQPSRPAGSSSNSPSGKPQEPAAEDVPSTPDVPETPGTAPARPGPVLTDITPGAWYQEAVEYAVHNGWMTGYDDATFRPNDRLTRAQLAQILYNKEGRPGGNGSSGFVDVAADAWYADAVAWAAANDIVDGYGDGRFGPNDNITREQLAVILWRYAGSPAAADKELRFPDADDASGYALYALCWAVENGILNGYGDGRLDPKGLATRAQVAQMLKNYINQ